MARKVMQKSTGGIKSSTTPKRIVSLPEKALAKVSTTPAATKAAVTFGPKPTRTRKSK